MGSVHTLSLCGCACQNKHFPIKRARRDKYGALAKSAPNESQNHSQNIIINTIIIVHRTLLLCCDDPAAVDAKQSVKSSQTFAAPCHPWLRPNLHDILNALNLSKLNIAALNVDEVLC
jgi:hypothetical protein